VNCARGQLVALLLLAGAILRPAGASGQIEVAVSSNAPALEEAVVAFKTAMGEDRGLLFFVPLDVRDPAKSPISAIRPRVAVAFGSRALEYLVSSDPTLPLLATMVMTTDAVGLARPQQLISTVSLSLSPAAILSKLKITFPGRKKLAVLLSPNFGSLRSELLAVTQRLGYSLEIIECAGPREVLEAFAALRGRADFVWCLPDANLFPAAAIPPIILASIRNQLPVIGFSEGFVRAGAAVGFYPDYADIGVQTAETVKRYLSKQELPHVEAPRRVRIAVNERILRILGIERPNLSAEVVVIR
jgi:ABC-type uncharacterized transport system substrate-binding protein